MSTFQRWYRTGTASVANGSTAVTGVTTAWLAQIKPGDFFTDGLAVAEVASVETNTGLTLGSAWPGATLSGAAYGIARVSPLWSLNAELATDVAAMLDAQTDVYYGAGAPSDALGSDGALYLQETPPILYRKDAGSWGSGRTLANAGYAATSTTSMSIGTGSKTFATQEGLAYIVGQRVIVAKDGSNYMLGPITAYGSGSMTVSVDAVVGSGTFASWSLSVSGQSGPAGPTGPAGAETFGISIYKSDGIAIGSYYADRHASAATVQDALFAEIIDGDVGSLVQFYLEVNGVDASGERTVTQGTPLSLSSLGINVAEGEAVNFVIYSITGMVRDLFLKSYGASSA